MNTARKLILRFLASRDPGSRVNTAFIATACAIGFDEAEHELVALDTLGLARLGARGWELTSDGRNFVQTRIAHE